MSEVLQNPTGKGSLAAVTFAVFTTRPTTNYDGSALSTLTGFKALTESWDKQTTLKSTEFDPSGGGNVRRVPHNRDWTFNWRGVQGGNTSELAAAINTALANYGACWVRGTWQVGSASPFIVTGIFGQGQTNMDELIHQGLTVSCDGIDPVGV